MTRRTLHWALLGLGVLLVVAAVISALVVRNNDRASLSLPEAPSAPLIMTEAGVLDAVDESVTIHAESQDSEPVMVAVGRTADVKAWIDNDAHQRITGLSSWDELTLESVTGEDDAGGEQDENTDPAGSDLWVAEEQGEGSANLDWQQEPGRWSLIAATNGTDPAPQIELEWGRETATPWLLPGIIVGGLLALAAAGLLLLDTLARRERERHETATARQELEWQLTGVTGPETRSSLIDPETGERYTRRQLREMERSGQTGEMPAVTPSETHLAEEPHIEETDVEEMDVEAPGPSAGDHGSAPGYRLGYEQDGKDEPTEDEPTEDEPTEDEPTEDEPTEDGPTASGSRADRADPPGSDTPSSGLRRATRWRNVWKMNEPRDEISPQGEDGKEQR